MSLYHQSSSSLEGSSSVMLGVATLAWLDLTGITCQLLKPGLCGHGRGLCRLTECRKALTFVASSSSSLEFHQVTIIVSTTPNVDVFGVTSLAQKPFSLTQCTHNGRLRPYTSDMGREGYRGISFYDLCSGCRLELSVERSQRMGACHHVRSPLWTASRKPSKDSRKRPACQNVEADHCWLHTAWYPATFGSGALWLPLEILQDRDHFVCAHYLLAIVVHIDWVWGESSIVKEPIDRTCFHSAYHPTCQRPLIAKSY